MTGDPWNGLVVVLSAMISIVRTNNYVGNAIYKQVIKNTTFFLMVY
jgi:hypothetical protein